MEGACPVCPVMVRGRRRLELLYPDPQPDRVELACEEAVLS